MLRICIVDDEYPIREGLAKMISKESDHFEVVGTCANGQEALDLLKDTEVDVVLTDIRMPLVDGLELIRILKEQHPEIHSILLSGFADFEYAREAIRHSVVDYLLKPINKQQLFTILHRLAEERLARYQEAQQQRSILLYASLTGQDSLEPGTPLPVQLPKSFFEVVVVKGPCESVLSEYSMELNSKAQYPLDRVKIQSYLEAWVVYFSSTEEERDFHSLLSDLLREGPIPIHLGCSRVYGQMTELRRAYTEGRQACNQGIYAHTPSYLGKFDISGNVDSASERRIPIIREKLAQELELVNVKEMAEEINRTFAELKAEKADVERLVRTCQQITELIRSKLGEFRSRFSQEDEARLEKEIRGCLSFEHIMDLFSSRILPILTDIRRERLEQSGQSVQVIKEWIMNHYSEPYELSTLARIAYLTPNYLSKLFKQETGMTITSYLIDVRIKKAKDLLQHVPDMKVQDIGQEVGYPDPAYFNKLFKRIVGVTPSEFRRIAK